MSGWRWNMFDLVMVMMQLFDMILEHFLAVDGDGHSTSGNMSFMRLLRILRIVRIVRIVRVLRYVSELRAMVTSILSSCRSLLWTLILVLLFTYVVSVYFTSLVADRSESLDNAEVKRYYGSLMSTLFSLFKALTNGVDWGDLAEPLMDEISPHIGFVFALYMCFAVVCIMNVITAIFVESSLLRAEEDKESQSLQQLQSVFHATDIDCNGKITRGELSNALREHKLAESIDIGLNDASALFDLLDVDNTGEVDSEEFVLGCLRIRGAVRGIDMANVMYFNKRIAALWADRLDTIDETLENILEVLQGTSSTASGSLVSNRKHRFRSADLRQVVATWSDLKKIGDRRVQEADDSEAVEARDARVCNIIRGSQGRLSHRLVDRLRG